MKREIVIERPVILGADGQPMTLPPPTLPQIQLVTLFCPPCETASLHTVRLSNGKTWCPQGHSGLVHVQVESD